MKTIKTILSVTFALTLIVSLSFSSSASCTISAQGGGECHIVIDNSGEDPVHSLECEDADPNVGGSKCKQDPKAVITAL